MKKATKRALMSLLVLPGLGQIQNGQKIKGIVFMVVVIGLLAGFCVNIYDVMKVYFDSLLNFTSPESMQSSMEVMKNFLGGMSKAMMVWIFPALIIWAGSGIDAYFCAKKIYGKDEGAENKITS